MSRTSKYCLPVAAVLLALPALADGPNDLPTDVQFAVAVEEWIYATNAVRDLDRVLPDGQASIVRRMGCEHYECRQAADREIAALGDAGLRAVVWGTHHRDAEIKSRSHRLLRFLICPFCDGTGKCQIRADLQWCSECRTGSDRCHDCHGWRRLGRPR